MEELGREGIHAYARFSPPEFEKSARIMNSDGSPKGRMRTMKALAVLAVVSAASPYGSMPAGTDDRGSGTHNGSLIPQLKKDR